MFSAVGTFAALRYMYVLLLEKKNKFEFIQNKKLKRTKFYSEHPNPHVSSFE